MSEPFTLYLFDKRSILAPPSSLPADKMDQLHRMLMEFHGPDDILVFSEPLTVVDLRRLRGEA